MRARLSAVLAAGLLTLTACGSTAPASVTPAGAGASLHPSTPAEVLAALTVADEELTGGLPFTRNADRDPGAPRLLPTCKGAERMWTTTEGETIHTWHREWLASAESGAAQWIYLRPVADAAAKQAQYAADDAGCADYVEMETRYRLVPYAPAVRPQDAYSSCREATDMGGAVSFTCSATKGRGTALVRVVSWAKTQADAEAALAAVLEPAARRLQRIS